jgi:hypothetical protein
MACGSVLLKIQAVDKRACTSLQTIQAAAVDDSRCSAVVHLLPFCGKHTMLCRS